jgi:hypothetical protein
MGVYATAFHHEHVVHHGGFGLFYKILVVPDWLLIEFAAKTVFSDHGTAVPLELSFRIPFHVGGCLHLAPGIGPLLIVAMHEDEEDPEAIFGLGSGIGISYWFTSWAGVKMELGYELHFHDKLSHELVAATGVVFGW